MTDERFTELLNGPLRHPSLPFTISRLALALKACVDASPEAEKALEEYCSVREREDNPQGEPEDAPWGLWGDS